MNVLYTVLGIFFLALILWNHSPYKTEYPMNNDQPPFMRGKYRKQFEASVKEAIEEKPVNEANNLIKRIDERFTSLNDVPVRDVRLTRDEWAQIRKYLPDCRAEIERKATYVPMTDDEISQMMQDWYNDTSDETSLPRFIETAVIKRAGLEIKHD